MSAGDERIDAIRPCPRCGRRCWHRQRGPDCMYAVCDGCDFGYDIGWGPRPDYFPEEHRD